MLLDGVLDSGGTAAKRIPPPRVQSINEGEKV